MSDRIFEAGHLYGAIWGLVIMCVVGTIVFGINSCSERNNELRQVCIRNGGTVINLGEASFHCVQPGGARPLVSQ